MIECLFKGVSLYLLNSRYLGNYKNFQVCSISYLLVNSSNGKTSKLVFGMQLINPNLCVKFSFEI